jgi:hypothetical protein
MRSTRWSLFVLAVALLAVPASASATADITSATFTRGQGDALNLTVYYTGTFNNDGFYWQLANSDTMSNLSSPTTFCSLFHGPEIGQCSFTAEPPNPLTLSFDTSPFYPDNAGGTIKASTQPAQPITGPAPTSSPLPPPFSDSVGLTSTVRVNPKTGKGLATVEVHRPFDGDLTEAVLYGSFLTGAHARSQAVQSKAKRVQVGTLADTHISASQTSVRVPLQLNGRGRRALGAVGKLKVAARAILKNSAGNAPVAAKLKLVAAKSKK